MLYTASQIATAAQAGGFAAKSYGQTMAVALALRESGGNTTARCYNSKISPTTRKPYPDGRNHCHPIPVPGWTSVDRGLWQINSKAHPDVSDAQADNPIEAAKAAYRISNGGKDWGAWVAVNVGIPAEIWDKAARATGFGGKDPGQVTPINPSLADPTLIGGIVAGHTIGVPNPLKGIEAIGALFGWFLDRHNLFRVGQIGFGITLIVVGVGILKHDTVMSVAQVAEKAAVL